MFDKLIRRVVFLVVTLALCVTLMLQTSTVRSYIIEYATAMIEEKTGWQVDIADATFYLPVQVTLNDVSVMEKGRSLFKFRHADISIIPFDFLYGKFIFHSIHINGLEVENLPEPVALKEDVETPGWEWLDFILKINDLRINDLIIAKSVLSKLQFDAYSPVLSVESPLSLKGSLVIDPRHQCMTGDLTMTTRQTAKEKTHLTFNCLQKEHLFGGQFNLTASSKSILLSPLGLENPGEGVLSGDFTAPDETWKKLYLGQSILSDQALTGKIDLKYREEEPLITMAAEYHYTTENFITIDKLIGLLGPVAVNGKASLSQDLKLDGTAINFTIDDDKTLQQWLNYPLQGGVTGDLHLSGAIMDPTAHLILNSPDISFDEYELKNVNAEIRTKVRTETIQGDLQLSFQKDGRQFHSSTSVAFIDDNTLSLDKLKVRLPKAQLEGSLSLNIQKRTFIGELRGQVDELLEYEELWDRPVAGAIRFNTLLTHSEKTGQSILLSLIGADLSFDDFKAEKALAAITLENLDSTPTGQISMTMDNINTPAGLIEYAGFSSTLNPGAEAWPYQLDVVGAEGSLVSCHSVGTWHHEKGTFTLSTDHLEGQIVTYQFSLQEPFSLKATPDSMETSPLRLGIDQGSLYGSIKKNIEGVDATLRIEKIPLEPVRVLYPDLQATGTLSMEAQIHGQSDSPQGLIELSIEGMRIQEESFAKLPPLQGHVSAEINDGRMSCKGWLTGIGAEPIKMDGNFPVTLSLSPPSLHFDTDKSLTANMSGSGPVAPFLDLFILETTNVAGNIDFNANITGTFNTPHISGDASFVNGFYEGPNLGITLSDIQAKLEADGPKVLLTELSASDRSKGLIKGKGEILITKRYGYPYKLNLQVESARIIRLDQVSAKMSGTLLVKGDIKGATVSGDLVSDSFSIKLPEQTKEAAQTVDVTYTNIPSESIHAQVSQTEPQHWPLNMDLSINVPTASVVGRGLDSNWKGSASIQGSTEAPLVYGLFNLTDGIYRFQGKTLELNEGTLTIDGDPGKKTSIYIIAGMDIDRMRIEAILRGPLKEPALSFRSNPPMSQREILSWLLFNRGLSDLTPFQGTELNESITDLTSGEGGPDLLTKLRSTLGIDRIDISSDETSAGNAVSVRVGKYISKGTFVSIGKNMTTDANTVSVEMNLFRDFKLEGQISDDRNDQLNLIWRHDY